MHKLGKWLIIASTLIVFASSENLTLIAQTRTGFIQKYVSYSDVTLMHFDIPEDTSLASFKIRGSDISYSIFGCNSENVIIQIKYGSPPVINPDGSKYPKDFYSNNTSETYTYEFVSSKSYYYINLNSPFPGTYYAIAYYPYTNPKDDQIAQQGLTPKCDNYIDANLYIREHKNVQILTNNIETIANIHTNDTENDIFKIYIPINVDHIFLTIKDIVFCDSCTKLITRIQAYNIPNNFNNTFTYNVTNNGDAKIRNARFYVNDDVNYYIKFDFVGSKKNGEIIGNLNFKVKHFTSITNKDKNETNVLKKSFKLNDNFKSIAYNEYGLIQSMSSDSFMYSYDMKALKNGSVPMSIDLTNVGFSVIKFHVREVTDIGGSLQFIFAFKPRIVKEGRFKAVQAEPEKNTIIFCVRNRNKEIPSWPTNCLHNKITHASPIVLSTKLKNESITIPFPEAGDWYVTMKLFCGDCKPCNCPINCVNEFNNCTDTCEINCKDELACNGCSQKCEDIILSNGDCKGCDCDGNCLKSKDVCNTTVIFDVSSYPCVNQQCGSNGKCVFVVHEGFVFSTCICMNNYRGWDCSDDTNANSFATILIELLLLVLSNFAFLPGVFLAYRRKYYIESIAYFATCVFSTFYHSCDAGENILSFCLVKLSVLQFADFYAAILSIYVTLIAMANLSPPIPHIIHFLGAILIACFTTYDKQSAWVFLLPVVFGIIVIGVSWGKVIYQTKQIYPTRRYLIVYLPIGLALVAIGLLLFTRFQTKNNYKYIHSVWHILMASAAIVLLPTKSTFQMPEML